MKYRVCFIVVLVLLFIPVNVFAAKVRVRTKAASGGSGVSYSSAKLSRSTNSVVLNLTNLSNVKNVTYEFSYTASGIPQGAMGSIAVAGQSTDSRDLYFGTCSHGVCTPHVNITGATLLVTTTTTSGATNVKRYRIKTTW